MGPKWDPQTDNFLENQKTFKNTVLPSIFGGSASRKMYFFYLEASLKKPLPKKSVKKHQKSNANSKKSL